MAISYNSVKHPINVARDRKADGIKEGVLHRKEPWVLAESMQCDLGDSSNHSRLQLPHLSHAELDLSDGKTLSSSNISESKMAQARRRERKERDKKEYCDGEKQKDSNSGLRTYRSR